MIEYFTEAKALRQLAASHDDEVAEAGNELLFFFEKNNII